MTTPLTPARALVVLAIALSACGQGVSTTDVATGTTTTAEGTSVETSPATTDADGPVRSLTTEERSSLEGDGTVLAELELLDGVVVAMGYDTGGGAIAVEVMGVPQELLSGAGFGGSGELLMPGDACNFHTVDEGFTAVITDDPSATVTVDGADGLRAVEQARAVTVGGREIGIVLVDVGHTQDSPRPSVAPGGAC